MNVPLCSFLLGRNGDSEFLCVVLSILYGDVVLCVQFCTPSYSWNNFVLIDVCNFVWTVVWFWYSVLEQYNVMFWGDFVL